MKTVTYPLLGISASIKAGATPKNVHYDVDVAYDKTQVTSKLDAKAGTKHPTDYSVDFEVREINKRLDSKEVHNIIIGR